MAVVGLGVVAVTGVGAAARGGQQMVVASREKAAISREHRAVYEELMLTQASVDRVAADYGVRQLRVQTETIGRFVRWLEANEKLVRRLDRETVDGVELKVPSLAKLQFDLEQVKFALGGGFAAAGAGFGAQAAALWGVGSLASASTGAAISSLSGAAAQSATLAWLGGGSLAAGGAGVAGGVVVLGFIVAAPAALVAGASLAVVGHKQRQRAREFVANAEVQIASMGAAKDLILAIAERVNELRDVLLSLDLRTSDALDVLEALEFDPDEHGSQLLRVTQLVRALREVLNVAVIDDDGALTESSVEIVARYK